MSQENGLTKSKYSIGKRSLDDLSHAELLEAVEGMWSSKNDEISKLAAQRDGYKSLLESPLPIHSLWRGFAENATLLGMIGVIVYLAGHHS